MKFKSNIPYFASGQAQRDHDAMQQGVAEHIDREKGSLDAIRAVAESQKELLQMQRESAENDKRRTVREVWIFWITVLTFVTAAIGVAIAAVQVFR